MSRLRKRVTSASQDKPFSEKRVVVLSLSSVWTAVSQRRSRKSFFSSKAFNSASEGPHFGSDNGKVNAMTGSSKDIPYCSTSWYNQVTKIDDLPTPEQPRMRNGESIAVISSVTSLSTTVFKAWKARWSPTTTGLLGRLSLPWCFFNKSSVILSSESGSSFSPSFRVCLILSWWIACKSHASMIKSSWNLAELLPVLLSITTNRSGCSVCT